MFDKFINALEKVAQPEKILTSEEVLIAYSMDATRITQLPRAVYFPQSTDELKEVLRLCEEFKVGVTARGNGTGLSGGAVPGKGSLVISFTKMNKIIDIDEKNLIAIVEPGVITAQLQKEVMSQNLFYPPDPSSASVSTIGGNIAEGAGGPRALKYGVTKDYVLGLEVVLSDGQVINTGGLTFKNVSGFDLTRLMVGSEGCLGLISRATLKLIPKPDESVSYLVSFKKLDEASRAVVEIIKKGILPTALEIMDKVTIDAVSNFINIDIPSKTEALLLIEADGYGVNDQKKAIDKVLKNLKPHSVKKAVDDEEVQSLWEARRAALPALSRISPSVLLEDATVPRSNLGLLIKGIQKIANKYDLIIGCFGHAGDGNLHPTIVTDMRKETNVQKTKKAIDEIFHLALKLRGTLTGEHGIGIVKKDYLELEIGKRNKEIMLKIKNIFDRHKILNKGKVLKEDK